MSFSLFSNCGTEITFTPNGEIVTVTIADASMQYPITKAREIYRGFVATGYTAEEPACDPQPESEWDISIDEADDYAFAY